MPICYVYFIENNGNYYCSLFWVRQKLLASFFLSFSVEKCALYIKNALEQCSSLYIVQVCNYFFFIVFIAQILTFIGDFIPLTTSFVLQIAT